MEYTRRERGSNPFVSVFWIEASSPSALETSCRYLAQRVGAVDTGACQDHIQLFFTWLSDREKASWILVLDSADDLLVWKPYLDQLLELKGGRIVFTSRNSAVAGELRGKDMKIVPLY